MNLFRQKIYLLIFLTSCLLVHDLLPVTCHLLSDSAFAQEASVQPSLLARGLELLKKGELEAAVKTFEDAAAQNPADHMPHFYIGRIYFRMQKYDLAIDALKKAIELNPGLAAAHTGLGVIYEIQGEYGHARLEYKAAAEGGEREAAERLGRLEIRMGRERKDRLQMAVALFGEGKSDEALKELAEVLKWDPNDGDALFNAAIVYTKMRRFREAIAFFKKVVEIEPRNAAAHLQLGYLYHGLGVYAEAKKEFESVINIAPGSEDANKAGERLSDVEKRIEVAEYFKQSSEFRQKGELESALSMAVKILTVEPENALAMHDMGVTYSMMGKKEEAIEVLKKAIAINPAYVEAHFELGFIYESQGRHEDAMAEYGAASGKETEESRKASERLEVLKGLMEAKKRAERIKAFLAGNDLPSALQEAEAYVSEENKNPEAHLMLGRVYLLLGKIEEAIKRLKVAMEIDPKYWDAYLLIGEVYEAVRRYPEAREVYKSVIAGAPDTPEGATAVKRLEMVNINIHFTRGKELGEKGDFEGALREMQKLLEIAPGNPVALFNAGVINDRLDRPEEAETFLKKAIEINPAYVEVHMQLALLYERTKRFEEARREYETVVSLAKEGREANLAKAKLGLLKEEEVFTIGMKKADNFIDRGNYAEAQKEIEHIIAISPQNYVAYYKLGTILDKMDIRDEAIRAFERAVEIKKDFPLALYTLGTLYEKENRFNDAREEYKKVVSLAEGTREGALAMVKLKKLKNWRGNFSVAHSIDTNLSYGVQKLLGVGTSYDLSLSYYLLRGKEKLLSAELSNSRSVAYNSQLWGEGYGASLRWEITLHDIYKLSTTGSYDYSIFDNEPSYWAYGLSGAMSINVNALPTSMSIRYNFSDTNSFKSKTSNAYQHSVNLSASQRFSPADMMSWGYGFTSHITKDPVGSNYASRSNNLSMSYSRTIKPGLSASISYSFGLVNYSNPDSTTLFQKFRRNTKNGINLGLSYSLSENVSMSINYNYNDVTTNLPPPSAEEQRKLRDILSDPIPTVGGGYRKDVISIGVGVGF